MLLFAPLALGGNLSLLLGVGCDPGRRSVTLIRGMRDGPPVDDGPDDGAVV